MTQDNIYIYSANCADLISGFKIILEVFWFEKLSSECGCGSLGGVSLIDSIGYRLSDLSSNF